MTTTAPAPHPVAARPHAGLRADGVTLGYGPRTVVRALDLTVPPGAVTAIVGPNGCGKSTLLRGLCRLLTPTHGRVLLDGADLRTVPTREVARRIGVLPQSPIVPEGITVGELVARGRHPHQRLLRRWTDEDSAVVADALLRTDTADLATREVESFRAASVSGVWIAMILAQRTDLLLLDEPTSFLDIAHQVEVLDLVRDLAVEEGTTVVMVLHDLAMSARYADHLVAMRDGRIVAEGRPRDVVTEATVQAVFGIEARVRWEDDCLVVIPLGRPVRRAPR